MTQIISGTANCSIDETHSGPTPQLSVQPESCQPHIDPPTPGTNGTTVPASADAKGSTAGGGEQAVGGVTRGDADSSAAVQPIAIKTIGTDAPGNQGLLENTVVEPLASWVGIGNPQAPLSNPVITTTAVGTTTGLAIDAAFFQFGHTKRVFRSSKRRVRAAGSATRAIFRF